MRTGRLLPVVVLGAALLAWFLGDALHPALRLWTVFLLVPLPALMVLQTQALRGPLVQPRIPLYVGSIVSLLLLAGLTLAIALSGGLTLAELGVRVGDPLEQLLWAAGVTIAGEAIVLATHRLGLRESPLTALLLPRSASERAVFAGLSITAGVCEELVFRGFLITVLSLATGSLTMAMLVSAGVFGVVHAYQEPAGAARAALLGLVLSVPFVLTGSLLGAVIAHAAIDVIGGFWLGPKLLGTRHA